VCVQKDRSALLTANYPITEGQKWLSYNVTWDITQTPPKDAPFPQSLQVDGCLYAYYYAVPFSLTNWMQGAFDGYVTSVSAAETDPRDLTGPQNLQTIFNWGNISLESVADNFNNITDSMTTTIWQQAEGNNSVPATGIVMQGQTCVSVHWAWLSFPTVLIIIIWVFFAATMLEQHKVSLWLPSWKSSLLPVLVHGMMIESRDDENVFGRGTSNEELRKIANKSTVRLIKSNQGLELK